MEKKRIILIVDDEEYIQEIIEYPLLSANHKIIKASGGAEAFEYILNDFVDIVITDIRMNKGSGVDLIKNINELPLDDRPVVYTMSGVDDITDEQLKTMGVKKMFPKPFEMKEIIEEICSTMKRIAS